MTRNPGYVALACTVVGTFALAGVFAVGYGGTIVLVAAAFFALALGVQAWRLARAFEARHATGHARRTVRRTLIAAIAVALVLGVLGLTLGRERGVALAYGSLAGAAWLAAAIVLTHFDEVVRTRRKRTPP